MPLRIHLLEAKNWFEANLPEMAILALKQALAAANGERPSARPHIFRALNLARAAVNQKVQS